jgi:putative phosphoribosyl transferase
MSRQDDDRTADAVETPGQARHSEIMSCSTGKRPLDDALPASENGDVRIPPLGLPGILQIPKRAYALTVFAHGSGSSRLSPRNTLVARALNDRDIATLLFDLLTPAEEADRANVFDIPLLATRLIDAVHWIDNQASIAKLPLGLFGASTGAAAALVAAAQLGSRAGAVVSRGGRPDLAGNALEKVKAPTLLIVGGADFVVIELNERALARLQGPKALEIVVGASHLFPEPGALEAVIEHAAAWFERHLKSTSPERTRALER